MKEIEKRIESIIDLAESYFGLAEVQSVSLKYDPMTKEWRAKLTLTENWKHVSYSETREDSIDALKALKKRIKRIIERFEKV